MASRGSKTRGPPEGINVLKFAESRAPELESLQNIVSSRLDNDFRSRRSKRKRTTSFAYKAAKKRCSSRRKIANKSSRSKDDGGEDARVPRRIRRRAQLRINPEKGFSTSGDGTKWLRTHVWHAKRFTMTKLWGFHLPLGLHGGGRGSRALLKRFRHGVLIHDASYHAAVQLEGPEDSLLSILRMVLVTSSAHADDVSHLVKSGVIYDNAMLHHVGPPVSKPIAPVIYMWRPCCKNTDLNVVHDGKEYIPESTGCNSFRQLWVWIHASAFSEGFDVLKFACQKEMDERGILINCISLEGELAKVEVVGLKAFQLLQKALHPVSWNSENSWPLKRRSVSEAADGAKMEKVSILENEEYVSSNAILSLTVVDPRTLRNERKTADVLESESTGMEADVPRDGSCKQFASEETSDKTKKPPSFFCSDTGGNGMFFDRDLWDARSGISPPEEESVLCKEIHELRKNFFCLGDPNSGTLSTSTNIQHSRCCPILLLKNKNQKGLDIGWSIILPLSWVRAFWIPLVSNGAHAIGLRERHWVACEVGLPYFPSDFPDCNAYSCLKATEAAASNLKEELFPPAIKPLKVPIPPPWDAVRVTLNRGLIKVGYPQISVEHESNSLPPDSKCADCDVKLLGVESDLLDGFVARTSCMLTNFLNQIQGSHLLLFPNKLADRKKSILNVLKNGDILGKSKNRSTDIIYNGKLCFLRVTLQAYSRGCFDEGAVVCAPFLTDISLWKSRSENIEGGLQVPQSAIVSYFREQSSGKWELQIPDDDKSHRWPIGFVTTGFVQGSEKPVAIAFCEAVLLASLREEQWNEMPAKRRHKEIYVLIRNLRSSAYRLALATIVLEQQEDVEYL